MALASPSCPTGQWKKPPLLSTRRNSRLAQRRLGDRAARFRRQRQVAVGSENCRAALADRGRKGCHPAAREIDVEPKAFHGRGKERSEEHTSELQSLMRNSYAGFRFEKNNNRH